MIKDTPDFQFPVVAIGANDGVIDAFLNLDEWAGGGELSVGPQSGGVAVDSAGSAWDIHCRQMDWPEVGGKLRQTLAKLLRVKAPVEYSFSSRSPMAWPEVIERSCAAVELDWHAWENEELTVGEEGSLPIPVDRQITLLTSQIRQAPNLEQVVRLLYWADYDKRPALVESWKTD
jgi:hypothetical protein